MPRTKKNTVDAAFAVEHEARPMAKLEQMDNITKDVLMAQALGYGCHYGRFKADYPHTREDTEKPVQVPENGRFARCPICKKTFYTTSKRRKYCEDICLEKANSVRDREHIRRKKEQAQAQ